MADDVEPGFSRVFGAIRRFSMMAGNTSIALLADAGASAESEVPDRQLQ
jgi:hypothetical protein